MSTATVHVATPNFVLLDGQGRVGPKVAPLASGRLCTSLYGFSSRPRYETFQANCQVALRPYPLVKVALRNESDAADDELKLVILEPVEPDQPQLHAALIETVLNARESSKVHLIPDHMLEFDPVVGVYRVNEDST